MKCRWCDKPRQLYPSAWQANNFSSEDSCQMIAEMWQFSVVLHIHNIFCSVMRTWVLSNLTPFFRVERIHQCLQDSGAFITGNIVLKMIHGGSWSESNITLVVNYTDWEFIHAFLSLEGYAELEGQKLPMLLCKCFDITYCKDTLTVTLSVYDTGRDESPLWIIKDSTFTSTMWYLNVKGIVVLVGEGVW